MLTSHGEKGAQVVNKKKKFWKLLSYEFRFGLVWFEVSSYSDQVRTDAKDYLNFPGIRIISNFLFFLSISLEIL